jgi:hypothetical protein
MMAESYDGSTVDVGGTAHTAAGGADPDPAAIRAEIRDTRERVGDTLEQLGERLNPTNLKEQVKEQVRENVTQIKDQVRDNLRDATIGRVEHMAQSAADRVNETRQSLVETIRENPIPAAMVGIGLGWLFVNRRQGGSDRSRGYYGRYEGAGAGYGGSIPRPAYGAAAYGGYPYGAAYGAGTSGGERYTGTGGQEGVVDRARERASEIGESVRDTAGGLADRAQHAAGAVADRAQHAAETVADRAQHVASQVADQTRYQARRVEDRFYESPLAVGAATLALGLAAGLALPATEREVELMGDARDRLVDRAKDAARGRSAPGRPYAERVTWHRAAVAARSPSWPSLQPRCSPSCAASRCSRTSPTTTSPGSPVRSRCARSRRAMRCSCRTNRRRGCSWGSRA